mgnify:CR=1 FL=1
MFQRLSRPEIIGSYQIGGIIGCGLGIALAGSIGLPAIGVAIATAAIVGFGITAFVAGGKAFNDAIDATTPPPSQPEHVSNLAQTGAYTPSPVTQAARQVVGKAALLAAKMNTTLYFGALAAGLIATVILSNNAVTTQDSQQAVPEVSQNQSQEVSNSNSSEDTSDDSNSIQEQPQDTGSSESNTITLTTNWRVEGHTDKLIWVPFENVIVSRSPEAYEVYDSRDGSFVGSFAAPKVRNIVNPGDSGRAHYIWRVEAADMSVFQIEEGNDYWPLESDYRVALDERVWPMVTGLDTATGIFGIETIAFSHDLALAALTILDSDTISLWDTSSFESLGRKNMRKDTGYSVFLRFSQDNNRLYAFYWDGGVEVYNVAGSSLELETEYPVTVSQYYLSIHPYEDIIAFRSGENDKGILLWDLTRGTQIASFEPAGEVNYITAVQFHPSGDYVAMAVNGDHSIRMWDWQTGEEVAHFSMPQAADVREIQFSPAGDQMIVRYVRGAAVWSEIYTLP